MESVRARIFFTESLSDTATPQMKCIILVPRSECPYVRSLKEHIRNKFSISDGKHLELSIDGFIIPDWEKSEVIRENDIISVRAMKAGTDSHTTLVQEGSYKKKKRKRSRGQDNLNSDNESGMHEVTQLVRSVPNGTKTKKKKKIKDSSQRKNEDETAPLEEEEDKMKTKHKKKDKKQEKEKRKKRKTDGDKPESLPEIKQTKKIGKDHNDEDTQNERPREFTTNTVANGLELQASVSSVKEIRQVGKASSQEASENSKSTADDSILLNSGNMEASNKNSVSKKRRRRKRKRKSSMITTGNGSFSEGTLSNNLSKPGYSVPRNGVLESDNRSNCTRIVNGKQSKITVPEDETVAMATSGGHIVFESESDGENDALKLHPSEQVLETIQSKEIDTKGTPFVVDNVKKPQAQQNKRTLVEGGMRDVRNHGEDEETASFNCVTPPEAGDEVTGECTVKIPEARNYDTYPPLNGPPRNGDIIAFKILELSSEYCPEVSDYKEGVVTEFNLSTQYVGIQLTKGPKSKSDLSDVSEGRFEMELDEEWTTDRNQEKSASLINVLLTSMIEPKLLSV